jgi:hypothetical protein
VAISTPITALAKLRGYQTPGFILALMAGQELAAAAITHFKPLLIPVIPTVNFV